MKRVVLVVSAFPRRSETFIVSKFLGLLAQGWDVHVVCRRSDRNAWAHFPELQQHPEAKRRVHVAWAVRPLWVPVLLGPFALAKSLIYNPRGTLWYLARAVSGIAGVKEGYLDATLIALRPDVVHFEFGALAAGRVRVKDRLGCKVTVSFRGYDINYVGLEQADYYEEVWKKANALHFLGEGLWQRAIRRGCPLDKKHILIPPAINLARFDPGERKHSQCVGSEDRPLRVLSVGRLVWVKGYEYALKAVALLKARGVVCEYTIVGDGPYLEAIAFARHQLGIEEEVHLAGAQSPEAIQTFLSQSDVFLHAAVSEGFCNAVMEAQAMHVPVVCTDADGLPENVADGETGFVVPRRDPLALADKVEVLARNPTLRQQMGEAGRKRVLRYFRLDDQIRQFSQFYDDILAHPSKIHVSL